jgi:hypothetical protein
MKKTLFVFIQILLLFSGCTKKEFQSLNFNGDLTGKINTYTEYNAIIKDNANILVTLEGSDPLITGLTDTSGTYIIKDIPLGTYNLIFSKDGYGTLKYEDFEFIGSDKPRVYSSFMDRKSTTKINNYTLAISGTTLTISGSISHHYPKSVEHGYPYYWPGIIVYLARSANVSYTNNVYTISLNSDQNNDTTFNYETYLPSIAFPHGSQLYAIIYGQNNMSYYEYDYVTGYYSDPCLGTPSEVKSIIVP